MDQQPPPQQQQPGQTPLNSQHADPVLCAIALIDEKFNRLSDKFDGLSNKVDGLSDKVKDLSGKVTANSKTIKDLSDKFDGLSNKVDGLSDKFDGLSDKVKDLSGKVTANSEAIEAHGDKIEENRQTLLEVQEDVKSFREDYNERFNSIQQDFSEVQHSLEKHIDEVKTEVRQLSQAVNGVKKDISAEAKTAGARLTEVEHGLQKCIDSVKQGRDDTKLTIENGLESVKQCLGDAERRLEDKITRVDTRLGRATNDRVKHSAWVNGVLFNTERNIKDLVERVRSTTSLEGDFQRMSLKLQTYNTNELARLANSFVGNDNNIQPLVAIGDASPIPNLPTSVAGMENLQASEAETILAALGALPVHTDNIALKRSQVMHYCGPITRSDSVERRVENTDF
ncbi:hypothetical protein B0H67DRAFT_680957 [Lasiosphaeris hirsuta]|uniref:Uncharacterized protein n=1 Tax=Lasiosphaeris hirsuta TaxID=260670 RepID=A0AA40E3F6_9PEZI|nr:hypothetical protein B0H67DRAFT_680957 [Lasiosphaeris hirsuta]